ncbi:MAG: DUF4166 domain-containing protein [Luteimonas sp.]
MTPTLFQKLLGASFYSLPPTVRALHGVRGHGSYVGRASIVRGHNWLARLCAAMARLPAAREGVVTTVTFDADAHGETWRRDFGGHRMPSRLHDGRGVLVERLGLLRFRFALHVHDGAIWWQATGARLLGVLPLPVSWLADVHCRESEHDGRYTFLVEASLPVLGRLIRYEGWLEPAQQD